MNTAYTILLQIIKMFLMILVGYYLYRRKTTDDQLITGLSNILLYVATPTLLVNSFLREYKSEEVPGLIFAFVLSFLIYVVLIITAEIFKRKGSSIEKFGIVFSNAGFIGIPLVSGVYGTEAVFYLAPYIAMFNIFVWTYGVYIMSKDPKEVSVIKVIKNPAVFSVLIGVLIYLLRIDLPSPISGSLSAFAGLNTPLAMIFLGAHIARSDLKKLFTDPKNYMVSFWRLVIAPLIILLLLYFVPQRWHEIKLILLIAAAAPIGALSPVFAAMYNEDTAYAAQTVCLSTLLSALSMPIIMLLAEMLW